MEANQNFENEINQTIVTENIPEKNNQKELPQALKISSGFMIVILVFYLLALSFDITMSFPAGWGRDVSGLILLVLVCLGLTFWFSLVKEKMFLITLNLIFYGFLIFTAIN